MPLTGPPAKRLGAASSLRIGSLRRLRIGRRPAPARPPPHRPSRATLVEDVGPDLCPDRRNRRPGPLRRPQVGDGAPPGLDRGHPAPDLEIDGDPVAAQEGQDGGSPALLQRPLYQERPPADPFLLPHPGRTPPQNGVRGGVLPPPVGRGSTCGEADVCRPRLRSRRFRVPAVGIDLVQASGDGRSSGELRPSAVELSTCSAAAGLPAAGPR